MSTQPASAQDASAQVAGPAGQVNPALEADVAHFGGSILFGFSWALVFDIGRVLQGEQYDFRVFATDCAMRLMVLIVGQGNSVRVVKRVARGTGDVTLRFTAPLSGHAIGLANAQQNQTCAGFVDTINR